MQLITPFRFLVLVCTLWSISNVQARPSEPVQNKQISKASSLVFIENRGQVTDQFHKQRGDIDFKLSAPGMDIFVGNGQIHYQWQKVTVAEGAAPASRERRSPEMPFQKSENKKAPVKNVETYRMDVVLLGANQSAQLSMQEGQEYYENYYGGDFEGKVRSYKKAIYKDIYPNIDWVLYIQDDQLKYDFVVHPGGDPADIKLQYKGATALVIEDGAFTATTPFGSLTEQAPYTYDAVTKAKLSSSFVLNEQTLSFKVAGKSKNDIVIDPALVWATYYGGDGEDQLVSVKSDATGRVYAAGYTNSATNIATTGAFLTTNTNRNICGLISAFRANGQRRWATYYGGGSAHFFSLDLDPSGNICAAGQTLDYSGIATSGAYQTVLNNMWTPEENMLIKFDRLVPGCGVRISGENGKKKLLM